MSTTPSERREPSRFVVDAIRRPIEDAVREGVKDAMREREMEERETAWRSGDGGGRGKYALLALFGAGVAAFLLWRQRGGDAGGGGGTTQSIRERSKAGPAGAGRAGPRGPDSDSSRSNGSETGGGAIEDAESDEAEDAAPEASGE